VAGLKPEQVTLHTTLLGGGFGRRANPSCDFVTEATEVAKAAKVPVKVVWTREDDIRGGWYRPMWYDHFAAGLDASGKPMTVRGGIADILESLGSGRMLLAYSGGLHHVQVPGERFPRLWKTIRMRLELVDIAAYRADLLREAGPAGLKRAVIADLERRRDLNCPCEPGTAAGLTGESEA